MKPLENPNGISPQSPGLRGTSYPGCTTEDAPSTLKGLWHAELKENRLGHNPFRVFKCSPQTQGSSFLATLGFEAKSRWDFLRFDSVRAYFNGSGAGCAPSELDSANDH